MDGIEKSGFAEDMVTEQKTHTTYDNILRFVRDVPGFDCNGIKENQNH